MAFPFLLAPAFSVGSILARNALKTLLAGLALDRANNYLNRGDNSSPDFSIPTSKQRSPLPSNISSLSSMNSSISTGLESSKSSISSAVDSAKASLESSIQSIKQVNGAVLEAVKASPLLGNQVVMKDSIDNLVNAIDNQTLASVSVLGTLDGQLSAIGGTLSAISATLLKISGIYSDDIANTTDMPYINEEDYYKMLRDSGLSFESTNDLIRQERAYVQSLKNSGVTDYSDIKRAVLSWRSQNVPSSANSAVSDNVAGLSKAWHGTTTRTVSPSAVAEYSTAVPPAQIASLPEINLTMPKTEAWATTALGVFGAMSPDLVARNLSASVAIKEAQPADTISRELDARMKKAEYLVQDTAIKDLDGNVVANVKPMEATAIKAVTDARLRTDMNNYSETEQDIDDSFMSGLDLSSLFTFSKKSVRLNNLMGEFGSGG